MTMDQTTANKLVTLAVLKKIVTRLDSEVRASVAMDRGDRKAAQAAGRRIGYVTMTDPADAVRVADREAFQAWVAENHPDEIVYQPSVRASFEKAMLERGCDDSGEAIPGTALVKAAPVLQVKPTPDAEAAIRQELSSTGLDFVGVLDALAVPEIEQ
ncbi:hypothetical protein H9L10_03660 [Phycicoccus endophyticus]|uniref:Uncharacterized protein n=1 Tax=Phycicoccus endophyticus TaxID=1690220 RepID=A0A7G9R3J1_9MICO|nr:hypothetical protein [Phycicoccus endophyticus]NHI19922.1 hypothetical protein [Phycicoccus endophyticus]QNN50166.1 hypothetical protein H9L10_03660 [Phycicoccus endophyticus]GGL27497.1 hypothetical protein GCM10012283_07110 [Phycicoccus endophyticus]